MARILQFGTSRFLQAHADLFIHEARLAGQDIGPITVVKTTTGVDRAGRVAAFADPAGYPVRIRGLADGQPVDRTLRVTSVTEALDATRDWAQVEARMASAALVICNTGEAGYAVPETDRDPSRLTGPLPEGFPAKLLRLLHHRFRHGAAPLLVLPCELVSENGQTLRRVLDGLAADWDMPDGFRRWLSEKVTLCDTLVDRIVSEAIEPVGAVAEPYALWAIRRAPGLSEPFRHPAVVYTDDLEPFTRLKLHILNLGHTWLAQQWSATGRPADETVRAILADPPLREGLLSLYRDEVIPGFAARGMEAEATAYVAQTVERFDNPFLDHRLADIFQNHRLKIERRVTAFRDWVAAADPALPLPRLAQLSQA